MNFTTKVVALAIAPAVAASLAAGCAGVSSTANQNVTASPSSSTVHTSDPTPAPEQSETIQVQVDKWVFGIGMTDEQLLATATANGYTATLDDSNDDEGTIIIYTLTREQQHQTLDTLRTNIAKAHAKLVDDDSTSFVAVNTSDAMDDVEVRVDADLYSKSETSPAMFYREAALFQGMAGVAPKEIAWKLRFVDDDTDKVLYSQSYSGSYAQWLINSDD